MNKFEKISRKQFVKDTGNESKYESIKIPVRATKYSAGYDFFAHSDFALNAGQTIKYPTGIKVKLDNNVFLALVPRGSLGFKYRLQLDNTIGIVDADYYNTKNEGHIWLKMTNDSHEGLPLHVKSGEAIAQGIILPYLLTEDDEATKVRTGGFGSTN